MSSVSPILIVEDDENDITIFKSALADLRAPYPIRVVHDGKAACRYLAGTDEYADRAAYPFPGLMLLDLKMPGMSGFSVLHWLGRHRQLRTNLRVVVVTSLEWSSTVRMVKCLGADEFMEKPIGYGQLKQRLQEVLARWQQPQPQRVALHPSAQTQPGQA